VRRAMPELSSFSKYVRFVHTEHLIHNPDQQTSYSVKGTDRPAVSGPGALRCMEAYVGAEAILDQCGGPLPGSDQEAAFTALIDLAPPRRLGRRYWTRPHWTWVSASRT
jgi:hypothetical protein